MNATKKVRVLHFVTGGFSGGATQVALGLVRAGMASNNQEPLLVLRKKAHGDQQRVRELSAEGVPLQQVNNWTHLSTILELAAVCRKFQPDVVLAHGYSEHLWGRYAALLAKVPVIVQVEHNTKERYSNWRLKQSRWLAQHTDKIIGCSEGVRTVLLQQGLPADKCIAIPNGINLHPFVPPPPSWSQRLPKVLMVARIAKQKDHATLILAIARLRQQGIELPLTLVGKGKARVVKRLQRLCQELGVNDLVHWLGYSNQVPQLLAEHKYFVQCTHYEGMPLTLLEAMAAGCAVIGSAVPGVQEVLAEQSIGLLHKHSDADHLASQLRYLLEHDDEAASMAAQAREHAFAHHSKELMNERYERLLLELVARRNNAPPQLD